MGIQVRYKDPVDPALEALKDLPPAGEVKDGVDGVAGKAGKDLIAKKPIYFVVDGVDDAECICDLKKSSDFRIKMVTLNPQVSFINPTDGQVFRVSIEQSPEDTPLNPDFLGNIRWEGGTPPDFTTMTDGAFTTIVFEAWSLDDPPNYNAYVGGFDMYLLF